MESRHSLPLPVSMGQAERPAMAAGRRAGGLKGTAPCTHPQGLAELLRHVKRCKQNITHLYICSHNILDFSFSY